MGTPHKRSSPGTLQCNSMQCNAIQCDAMRCNAIQQFSAMHCNFCDPLEIFSRSDVCFIALFFFSFFFFFCCCCYCCSLSFLRGADVAEFEEAVDEYELKFAFKFLTCPFLEKRSVSLVLPFALLPLSSLSPTPLSSLSSLPLSSLPLLPSPLSPSHPSPQLTHPLLRLEFSG